MNRAGFFLVLCACGWTQGALAESRIVVRPFTGATDEGVRETVVQSIADAEGMVTVPNKEVDSTASSLSANLETEAGRVGVARELSIAAFVEGDVKQHGATTQVSLRVYEGRDGGLLTDVGIRAPHALINSEVRKRFLAELGNVISQAQPPPLPRLALPEPPPPTLAPPAAQPESPPAAPQQAEPRAESKAAPTEAPASEPEAEAPSKSTHHALELGAGLLVLTRNYAYRDALLKLSEHTVAPTPALRIDARLYPAAYLTDSFVSNLGLDLYAQLMWPVDAKKGATTFETSGIDLGIAARYRIPLSEVSDHELGLVVGYGGHTFAIDGARGQDPGIPSVGYGFVHLGADGRLMLRKGLTLQVRLAYLAMTGFGGLGERTWFPHVGGGGLDGELGLAFDLSELVALTASGGFTRYFMSLNPRPTDAGISLGRIAGGLTDQYAHALLGVRLRP
jgi:hypothetical protein